MSRIEPAILDLNDDLMDRLFNNERRREITFRDPLMQRAVAAMVHNAKGPLFARPPRLTKKLKVSPAKMAKRAKQAAQKRARKTERQCRT